MPEPAERTTSRFALRQAAALLGVLLLALAVRVYVVGHAEGIAQDGVVYLYMAREFQEIGPAASVKHHDYHPGYPLVVAAAARLVGADSPEGWVSVGRWVSVVMSLVALAGLYFVAWAALGHRIGLLTVLILGLSGAYARTSCDVISDSTAAAMVALSVALGLGALRALRSGSEWALLWAAGAGLGAGAGYLTRPEAILGGLVAAALLVSARRPGRKGRAIQIAALTVLAGATLACLLPYAGAIGGFTQKKGLSDFVVSGGAGSALAAAEANGTWAHLEALRRGVDRLRASVGTPVAVLSILTLATWVGGCIRRLRLPESVVIKPTREGVIVMFLPAVVMIPLVIAMEIAQGPRYISSRHMLLPGLFLALAAGAAVVTLAEWTLVLAGALRVRRIRWAAVWGWSIAIVVILMFQAFPILHRGKGCFRRAGLAIREHLGPGRPILTDDPRVALFAGSPGYQFTTDSPMRWLLAPGDAASVEQLIRRAGLTHDGVGYAAVALSGATGARIVSKLPPEKFAPIGEFESGRKEKVWVFQRR